MLHHVALVRTNVFGGMSVLTRATRHNIPEDSTFHNHPIKNYKSYILIINLLGSILNIGWGQTLHITDYVEWIPFFFHMVIHSMHDIPPEMLHIIHITNKKTIQSNAGCSQNLNYSCILCIGF
jgi:hypothetical protein